MWTWIKKLFTTDTPLIDKPQSDDNELVRNLVMRYSRGNASLKLGWWVTKEEMEKRKAEILKHEFK